jgi:hypothetical protein
MSVSTSLQHAPTSEALTQVCPDNSARAMSRKHWAVLTVGHKKGLQGATTDCHASSITTSTHRHSCVRAGASL